jgi:hypothetical protein
MVRQYDYQHASRHATLKSSPEIGDSVDSLRDRIEVIEMKGSTPKRPGAGAGDALPANVKTLHTAHGAIFELPWNVKVADVLPNAKAPEISLDRWLAATCAGPREPENVCMIEAGPRCRPKALPEFPMPV